MTTRGTAFAIIIATAALAQPAKAYDFPPLPMVDLATADAAVAQTVLGDYLISDKSTQKNCKIRLLRKPRPGGMIAAVNYACKYVYPVMEGMKTWRYLDRGAIEFVDDSGKSRVRLTPENGAFTITGDAADIAGMEQVAKLPPRVSTPLPSKAETPKR